MYVFDDAKVSVVAHSNSANFTIEVVDGVCTITAVGNDYLKAITISEKCNCVDVNPADHECDVCGETLSQCVDNYVPVVTDPTCTESGYTTYTCSVCGDSYVDDAVDPLGHKEETIPAVDPTCTETGLTEGKKCSVCGTVTEEQKIVAAKGHTVVVDEAVAPTCTSTGLTEGSHCSVCGEVLVKQTVVDALGHRLENVPQIKPTCTEAGHTAYQECTRTGCNYETFSAVLPATGHSWKDATCEAPKTCGTCGATEGEANGHTVVVDEAVAPTCTATGLTEGSHCSVCKKVLKAQTVVEKLDHTPGEAVKEDVVESTCTSEGNYELAVYCSVCKKALSRDYITTPKAEHAKVTHEAKAATCTEIGWNAYETCKNCSYTTYVELPALDHIDEDNNNVCDREDCKAALCQDGDHVEGEGEVTTPATCVATGIRTFKCTACGEILRTEEIAIDENAHNMVEMPSKAASCEEPGHSVYDACTLCGFEDGKNPLPALGHMYTIDVAAKDATCTEAGHTAAERCMRCDFTRGNETIPALGHDLVDVAEKKATCTVDGYTAHTKCSRCDYTEGKVVIPATDHAWDNDCDTTCNNCGETRVIEHDIVTDAAVAATCTTPGKTEGSHCSVCNEVLKAQTVVPAPGHDPGEPIQENIVPATCAKAGSYDKVYYCTVCKVETRRETGLVILATGEHKDTDFDYDCDVCGTLVEPEADSIITIEQAIKIGKLLENDQETTNKYYVSGIITEITDTEYGNSNIEANGHTIYVYGIYDENGTVYPELESKPYAGDSVKLYGTIKAYNDIIEIFQPVLVEFTHEHSYSEATCEAPKTCGTCGATEGTALEHSYTNGYCTNGNCGAVDPNYYFPVTITEALEAADGRNVQVSGTVCAINTAWSDSYGNISVTIKDADDKELYIYRLTTNVALGDIITVKGAMATYDNSRQIGAGSTAEITGHDSSYDYAEMTIEDAIAAEDNTNVIVTGTVVKIGIEYNSQYNNISVYIADDNGKQLYLYRLSGNVEVGQIIKVKGAMATYNNNRQLTGGTFEAVGTHTCTNYKDATCQAPKTCVVCGVAKDDVLSTEHDYVDGVCSVCGGIDPDYEGEVVVTEEETLDIFATTGTLASDSLSISWEGTSFTFVNEKNTSSTDIRTSDSNHFRVYVGNKTTISAKGGYEISKIVITCTSTDYANALAGNTTIEGATCEVSGSEVTLTVANGVNTIVITTAKQWRLSSIAVYYTESNGSSTPEQPEHTHTSELVSGQAATCCNDGWKDCYKCECGAYFVEESCETPIDNFDDWKTSDDGKLAATGEPHTYVSGECRETNPKEDIEYITSSVSIENYAYYHAWVNGTKYASINIDRNITAAISGGGNSGKYYTDGHEWRMYQTENSAIAFTAAEGVTIVSVKITYVTSNNGVLMKGTAQVASDDVYAVNAETVTFTIGNTDTATNGQVKITAIEVVYYGGEALCAHTTDETLWGEGVVTKDPTCTEQGITTYKCSAGCGETRTVLIAATGHSYGEGEVTTAATCTTAGVKTFTCGTCNDTKTEEIAATGHNYVDGKCSCGATESAGGEEGGETPAEPVTASKTVADLIVEYGWTSSTTKQSFNLDDNVTVKINGGSNTGKAYEDNHIRIYATDTPAGTITISVPEGYELVSVKITALTGTYAFLYVDGTTTDISNVETAVSGTSVVLNSVKNGSNGKQVRVTAFEVVYKEV